MIEINTINDKHNLFKQRLLQLADTPKSLHYMGTLPAENRPLVAIVGSRKPTPYGQAMTRQLAFDLAAQGVVIVSGLALGVDGIAHQGALDADGITIAVLGGGLGQLYPYRHRRLAQNIIKKGGALISEYPAQMPCLPHQFIARNRIIAALSDGILVTEAALKSGSLHTANFGLDMGRCIMAVPGLATNPMTTGCLNLLKSGATLVTNASDVLFALGYTHTAQPQQLPLMGTPEEILILQLLRKGAHDADELLKKSNLETPLFNQTLTMLEITGKISALGGGQWMAR